MRRLRWYQLIPIVALLASTGCVATASKAVPMQSLTRINAGQQFTPNTSGYFLPDELYGRVRQALADKIQEITPAP